MKLTKVTMYLITGINNPMDDEYLKSHLHSLKYIDGIKIDSLETVEAGEYADDHPLNMRATNYNEYFDKLKGK